MTYNHEELLASFASDDSSSSYERDSNESESTNPTEYSGSPASYHTKAYMSPSPPTPLRAPIQPTDISTDSIPSTVSSHEDLPERVDSYAVPGVRHEVYWTDAMPASSADFAELFPSSRHLLIRHDDSTEDGNMNLRVDTRATTPSGRKLTVTLFHLRMKDLRTRDFSLRRYCRDSGREICHCTQKAHKGQSEQTRPRGSRSLSSAINPFKHKNDSRLSQHQDLKRRDSGYDSWDNDAEDNLRQATLQKSHASKGQDDFISCEFSNYAHVAIKRKGLKADKKHEFEYWGVDYAWQRVTQQHEDGRKSYSYHLMRKNDQQIVAHITPTTLSASQRQEELEQGSWIPPCSMRITDQKVLESSLDVAETIVATGLIALADDTIRSHFHAREAKHFSLPHPALSSGPKRLIDEAFGRRSRPHTAH